ncbi:hypothetical protein EI983_17270 [Roseovarius faecimaris]|uniref:Uncharacterized protein n=1 Tax=Roseovarius faecimaris TaxID=2494550 RepID=A0A6I6IUP1_9RHOB|nr:hypothetical protein [Roseovarius faecimaris]QGX99922.1 hypothetical protein EI983_17270 [Roseovarius faecimaris]
MPILRPLLALLLFATPALSGAPEIVSAKVEKSGMSWRVEVTLKHEDTGWDHYADGWDVLDATGKVLGHRELLHPHVDEQPFTRSLSNLMLPDGTREVFIRAHCSVKGWSDDVYRVELSP